VFGRKQESDLIVRLLDEASNRDALFIAGCWRRLAGSLMSGPNSRREEAMAVQHSRQATEPPPGRRDDGTRAARA
jgi:hypothetical protein